MTPFLRQTAALFGWLLLCFSAAASAVFVSPGGWYAALHKPSWTPPAWVFGPVWTTLYTLMAVAAWLIWREGGWKVQRRPLQLFLFQWVLNALWTPLFFGMHRTGWALAEIILFWFTLAVTLVMFWRINRAAGMLMVPYLLWVSIATALNFSIWRLNP